MALEDNREINKLLLKIGIKVALLINNRDFIIESGIILFELLPLQVTQ